MKVTSKGKITVIPPPRPSFERGRGAIGVNGHMTHVIMQMEVLAKPEPIRKSKPKRKKKK